MRIDNMIRAHPIRLGVRVMGQSDSDYLKGFTLLQSKDALGEAWGSLKKAWYDEEDYRGDPEDEPEHRAGEEEALADFHNTEDEHEANSTMKGHHLVAQALGVHPASVKLAVDRMEHPAEARRKAGWAGAGENDDETMDHIMDGETDYTCWDTSCGWGGKGHELHRDHPLDEGRCPRCALHHEYDTLREDHLGE